MTNRTVFMAAALAGLAITPVFAQPAPAARGCTPDNGGITLSPGFCAGVFAENIGHARHMVMTPDGTLFVNTWSGRYYQNDTPPPGGFIVALRDTKGIGKADDIQRFGDASEKGAGGGTGIALYNNALYVEEKDRILRYALNAGLPKAAPELVLSDMPMTGDHPMHPFTIDAKGNLFVDIASATNACQRENRQLGSPGISPCTELETRAGIWKYDANKTGQHFSAAERFATGNRNAEGYAFDSAGRLFVTQHGRDQLSQNWPALFTNEQNADLPAEEVMQLEPGADYGWPQCYYDQFQKKLVLAPEYGGDGKTIGVCAQKTPPVAAFPGHWGPNDLLIYNGSAFPEPYRGGMFVAFHGSWNRAPLSQAGFAVIFQPFKDGKATGDYVTFADGFVENAVKDRATAAFRPSELAMGNDGALYIADDKHGRIWRVVFAGDAAAAKVAAAPAPNVGMVAGSTLPPEGIHSDAGRANSASLPVPPGRTREQVALGDRIFHGEEKGGTCSGCHGSNGEGTSNGASLIAGKWLWGDGSLPSITRTIKKGVPSPKQSTGAMPPMGGTQLSQSETAAVAAYVWAIGHTNHAK